MTIEDSCAFPSIQCDRPATAVLRPDSQPARKSQIAEDDAHRELAHICRVVDRNRETRAVLLYAKRWAFPTGEKRPSAFGKKVPI
jgi:enoyl-CoA hydratase